MLHIIFITGCVRRNRTDIPGGEEKRDHKNASRPVF